MTSLVLLLLLTGHISIFLAADILLAFLYPFFMLFITLAVVLMEVPDHKVRYYLLGFLQSFIAASIGYSFKTKLVLGQSIAIGWPYFLVILFLESALIVAALWWTKKYEKIEPKVGTESMVGETATIVTWNGTKGRVRFEGEIWKAKSEFEKNFDIDDEVTVRSVDESRLIIGV